MLTVGLRFRRYSLFPWGRLGSLYSDGSIGRIEELLNYFPYGYAPPAIGAAGKPVAGAPFAVYLEVASAPWAPEHRLVRIGLKGNEIDWRTRPPSNLVFLLDVSGSMRGPDRLDLVKESIGLLVKRLGARDLVSIVVYAGASGLALPPTAADRKDEIMAAIGKLEAGGSTNGGEGIALAYKTARQHFHKGGNNRVILCTDADFNVGTTDRSSLVSMVEFNPSEVGAYRLIGYENRLLEAQDFDDDSKDAGDIGAGHTVTAFYEIVPRGMEEKILRKVAPLKYQNIETGAVDPEAGGEVLTLKLRYKTPGTERSQLLTFPLEDGGASFEDASQDYQFAAAVASFGMLLRQSDYRGGSNLPLVLELARDAIGDDRYGYRKQFVKLVDRFGDRQDRGRR